MCADNEPSQTKLGRRSCKPQGDVVGSANEILRRGVDLAHIESDNRMHRADHNQGRKNFSSGSAAVTSQESAKKTTTEHIKFVDGC